MELLIGKGHILIDAFLSEATLPRIALVRIPEYLASLVKLSELSDKGFEDIYYCCLPQVPVMMKALSEGAVNFARLPLPSLVDISFAVKIWITKTTDSPSANLMDDNR